MPGPWRIARWIFWIGGIALFVFAIATSDIADGFAAITAAGPILALGLVPYIVQIGLDALAWRALLGALGHHPRWARLVAIRLATEAVLLSVPGGTVVGESLKAYLLARNSQVPLPEAIASVGIKRPALGVAQGIYMMLAVALGATALHLAEPHLVPHLPLLVALAGATVAIVSIALGVMLASTSVAARVRRLLARVPIHRIRRHAEARHAGYAAADAAFAALGRARGRIAGAVALLACAWLVEAAETALLCRLVGIHLPITYALAMEASVVFARNVAFVVPAGLGVQDAGYFAFLAGFGIAAPARAAFVVVKRCKEIVWTGIGYALLALLGRRSPRLDSSSEIHEISR